MSDTVDRFCASLFSCTPDRVSVAYPERRVDLGFAGHLVLLPMADVGACAGCGSVGNGKCVVLCSA